MEIESGKPKVLVIEDNILLSDSLYIVLGDDFDVTIASDGNAAMSLIYHNSYDAILCDILLPDKNGRDIFKFIKHIKPHLLNRLVFTSGGPVEDLDFVSGIPYIPKPYGGKQIKNFLNNIIYN